jgi:hypothetical protein
MYSLLVKSGHTERSPFMEKIVLRLTSSVKKHCERSIATAA